MKNRERKEDEMCEGYGSWVKNRVPIVVTFPSYFQLLTSQRPFAVELEPLTVTV